ncbi:hypothetical protein M9Y10_012503 [Tritrichomonas musculus]|uniref:Protein kinase domain-containing protein n=1 Tax=Tritrichomonas musculus TaxID=1915356 RepID=A0ABR2ICP3_9EUKA
MIDFDGLFFDTDDYVFESNEQIGEGRYGKVYIVKCIKDDNYYAAKIIKINKGLSAQEHQNLLRESSILRKLNHPSIIKFYGINFQSLTDISKLEPTILTEYMPKGSLRSLFSTFTATKKYICILGISNAMKYLHEQGIIHKDLKLDNILIDQDDFPRICDFGLSICFPQSLTMSMNFTATDFLGTPMFMSPELLKGDDRYGPGIDVYAFSMLVYELITNRSPFPSNLSFYTLASKVINGERPNRDPSISNKMWKLLELCWQEKDNERPSFEIIFSILINDLTYFSQPINRDEIMNYINRFDMNYVPSSGVLKFACQLENTELVQSLLSIEAIDVNKKFISI